jgi:hypothetical protein
MNCQLCGASAPTKNVEFHQNIGAIILRFNKKVQGNLCKSCVHKKFWEMTLITLFLGWWGMISLIVTPIFLINNIVRYIGCLGMPAAPALATQAAVQAMPPPIPTQAPAQSLPPAPAYAPPPQAAAPAPELTQQVVDAINPHIEQIAARLNAHEDQNRVAADIAAAAGVTPAEAMLYIHALVEQSRQAPE